MATRLVDMEIDEVSLVDNPAHPDARVVLYKRDVDNHPNGGYDATKEVDMSDEFDIDVLPEEARTYVNKLEDLVIGLQEQVEGMSKNINPPKEEDKMEEILKSASDEVKELVAKAQADAQEAQEVAKAERDARVKREYLEKAHSLPEIPRESEELGEYVPRS